MIKYLIITLLLLLPCLSFAETKCKIIEFTDYDEVDCSGDETEPKTSDPNNAAPQPIPPTTQSDSSLIDTDNTTPSDVSQKPETFDSTVNAQVTSHAAQPAQPASNQGATINRQGRQQYQKAHEDAKAARMRLILENQPLQTASPPIAPPVSSGTTPK